MEETLLPTSPVSQSSILSPTLTLTETNDKTPKKRGRPFKIGNPGGGRPKGSVSLKARLLRLMTPENVDELAKTLLDMANKEHNIQALKLIAELAGDLSSAPQVTIQSNTLISSDLITAARQFLADKDNASAITDVSSSVKLLS